MSTTISKDPTQKLIRTTTVQYTQKEEQEIQFTLRCHNIPVGSMVALSSNPEEGPEPPIHLPKTTVTSANFSVGTESKVPAGYKGKISYGLYANEELPPDSSVAFTVAQILQPPDGKGPKKLVIVLKVITENH